MDEPMITTDVLLPSLATSYGHDICPTLLGPTKDPISVDTKPALKNYESSWYPDAPCRRDALCLTQFPVAQSKSLRQTRPMPNAENTSRCACSSTCCHSHHSMVLFRRITDRSFAVIASPEAPCVPSWSPSSLISILDFLGSIIDALLFDADGFAFSAASALSKIKSSRITEDNRLDDFDCRLPPNFSLPCSSVRWLLGDELVNS
jgi:hypothetical protein